MYKHREKCSCKEPYRNEVADTGEHHEADCPRGIQLRAEKKATESPALKRVMDFGQEGAKRQNAPYVLTWNCKGCGKLCSKDFRNESYLSSPEVGKAKEVCLYCKHCEHEEEKVDIKFDIVLSLVR